MRKPKKSTPTHTPLVWHRGGLINSKGLGVITDDWFLEVHSAEHNGKIKIYVTREVDQESGDIEFACECEALNVSHIMPGVETLETAKHSALEHIAGVLKSTFDQVKSLTLKQVS